MKIKLNEGLKLTKKSLSKLQESQMAFIKGGTAHSSTGANCCCKNQSSNTKHLEEIN